MDDNSYDIDDLMEVEFPQIEGSVTYNTVVYVKGVGMSLRATGVPGARPEVFWEDVEGVVCDCAEPSMWHFTGIDGTKVVTLTTVDPHLAMEFLLEPDMLFEETTHGTESPVHMLDELTLVPPSDKLPMVVAEFTSWVEDKAGMKLSDAITYEEVKAADVISIEEFLREGRND